MNTNLMTTGAPYALGLGRSRALVACPDLAAVSRAYRAACEAHTERTGKGASTMAEGRVYDTSGAEPKQIGNAAWNGTLWAGRAQDWTPDAKPLYDPAAAQEGCAR